MLPFGPVTESVGPWACPEHMLHRFTNFIHPMQYIENSLYVRHHNKHGDFKDKYGIASNFEEFTAE